MAIYMQISGIDGNVTTQGYENWIELDTFNFKVQRHLNTQPGHVANREGTKPNISEIVVTKHFDKSSSRLFGEATVCTAKAQVKISFVTTSNTPTAYLEYTLSNVIISGHDICCKKQPSISEQHNDFPIEHVYLNFDKIEMKVIPFDKNHKPQSPIPAGYDLSKATAI